MEATPAAHWQRVKELLAQALEQPVGAQAAWIARACGDDVQLHAELASLLYAAQSRGGLTLSDIALGPTAAADAAVAPPPDDPADWIGRRIGAWRIVAPLARGGMGDVYRAERADAMYRQDVALKLMVSGLGPAARTRFEIERQILASLDHPNLAKLLDGGLTACGTPYLVMELVDGVPIDRWIDAEQPGVRRIVQKLRVLCQVVHHAHRRGVVHRDLKPGNVLIGGDGTLKLLDFGIAKVLAPLPARAPDALDDAGGDPSLPMLLTPEYASPEQVRGETVTSASDVYSLGVLMYRLLTGVSPYGESLHDLPALSRVVCEVEPIAPSVMVASQQAQPKTRSGALRGDLDAVVLKSMRKRPEQRYESAEAVADDLFRHLEGLPVRARRGAWGYIVGRWIVRHRPAVMTSLLIAAALAVGSIAALQSARLADAERRRAEAQARSARDLTTAMLFEVDDALRAVPGTVAARKLIVERSQRYLSELSAQSGRSAVLDLDVARAWRKLGDTQGRPHAASLGDGDGALASYQRAIALLEPLLGNAAPRDPSRYEASVAYQRLGALLGAQHQLDAADRALARGVQIAQAWSAAEPADVQGWLLLATLIGQRSQIQMFAANIPAFLDNAQRAIELLEKVVRARPGDVDAVINLASNHSSIGEYFLQRDGEPGSAQQSAAAFQKAVTVYEFYGGETATHPGTVRGRANALDHLGEAQLRLGQVAQAETNHRRAYTLHTGLVDRDPANAQAKKDLAIAASGLGAAMMAKGEPAAARPLFEQAQSIYGALPAALRQGPHARYTAGVNAYRLGLWHGQSAAAGRAGAVRTAHVAACARHLKQAHVLIDELARQPGLAAGHLQPDQVMVAAARCAQSATRVSN
jgi:eukaryotic-like serine/threonine-protein kinase